MAAVKFTMVFSVATSAPDDPAQARTGGWSESVYTGANTPSSNESFRTLCQLRAALLPRSARISGIRVQGVDPSTRATLQSVSFPGAQAVANETDIPQMSLALTVPDVDNEHSRRIKIACIPDRYIVRGEFLPLPPYARALNFFLNALGSWQMRSQNFALVKYDNISISATGLLKTVGVPAYFQGEVLRVYSAVQVNGRKVSGAFKVEADNAGGDTQLVNWPYGACTGGKHRKVSYIYPVMLTIPNPAVIVSTRKVGRPTAGYRGRRSKTKR